MISEVKNIDCIEGMKAFPDKFFDLAIVDPPYTDVFRNMHKVNKGNRVMSKEYEYATLNTRKPNKEYFIGLGRISKHQIVFGGNYFLEFLKNTSCFIVWDKDNTGNYADAELAWTSFFGKATRIFKYRWNGMLQQDMKDKEERIHPTQKPIALYKWLLHNYAKQGDKILDTHLGSGSSRIAAYNMGFDFWGFELDKDYYEAQEKRFKEQTAQLKMFASENANK